MNEVLRVSWMAVLAVPLFGFSTSVVGAQHAAPVRLEMPEVIRQHR